MIPERQAHALEGEIAACNAHQPYQALAGTLRTLASPPELGDGFGVEHLVARVIELVSGAGFGEPLHTMRTVRECIRAGIAGVHIEDQLFPKRAHYHTYFVHNIPLAEYRDKLRLACEQRDKSDKDFVVIARSDAARVQGFKEAIKRVNVAADNGADMGLVFPRTHAETVATPRLAKVVGTLMVSSPGE